MTAMKKIEVSIMGSTVRLTCPDGDEKPLHEAVSRVDREMCAIRDSGKVKVRERIAVLAALNLAYTLAQKPQPTPVAAAGPDAASAASVAPTSPSADPTHDAAAGLSDAQLDALIARLDRALEHDGYLL